MTARPTPERINEIRFALAYAGADAVPPLSAHAAALVRDALAEVDTLQADIKRATAGRNDVEEDARRWCNELRDLAASLGFADAIGREDFGEVHLPALYAWRDEMLAERKR